MLILPLQHTLSWRKPPFLTLALIIINVAVFLLYQLQDEQKIQDIYKAYDESVLAHLEAHHYVDYLERNLQDFDSEYIEHISKTLKEKGPNSIAPEMALDLNYVAFLDQYKEVIWDNKDRTWWQKTRHDFYQNHIKTLSNYAYGFIPAEFEVHSVFTYQFLHGGWGHLIGNMLILFILGFGLERILGRIKLMILYLLTGALSAIAYAIVSHGSPITLVGASGSISGFMGVFVGVYGLQKIQFFYFLGVAFGYFKFPALIILPIWVANELIQHVTSINSHVAYFAHIGGLVSGGALAFIFRQTWLKPKEDEIAKSQADESSFKHDYQQALELIELLKFEHAKKQFAKLWQANPDKPFLLDHLYHLYKIDPSEKGFHHVINLMIQHQSTDLSEEHWQRLNHYVTEPHGIKHLSNKNLITIVRQSIEDEQFSFIAHLLEQRDLSQLKPLLATMYQAMIDYAKSSAQATKAQHYQQCLDRL